MVLRRGAHTCHDTRNLVVTIIPMIFTDVMDIMKLVADIALMTSLFFLAIKYCLKGEN